MQRLLSFVKTISLVGPNLHANNTLSSVFNTLKAGPGMLVTTSPLTSIVCGMKVKGRVRRRCKSCYFVVRDERMYIMCHKHPRHKQMAMKPKPHNTWILTHASQSPVRPW